MFPVNRCQTKEDRMELAYELFHEELGHYTTDQDFMAKWCIESIEVFLDIFTYDPDPFWVVATRETVKKNVLEYRRMYADFTKGHVGLNDNQPLDFNDLR